MDLLKDKKKFKGVVKDVFKQIDENGNGSIEFSEMKKAIQAMYDNTSVNPLSEEQIDEAIINLDQDNNKMINESELFDLLRTILKQSVPEYTSDSEGMMKFNLQDPPGQTPKQGEKNGSSTFRTKKVQTREEKKQELKKMKEDLQKLKQGNQNSRQLQNQKIVNVFLNPNVDESEVKKKQLEFDKSNSSSSYLSPASSSKSSISLNPLVLNQQIRQGFFKNAEDIIKAQSQLKNNHLIGVAVKRMSAGDWQGLVDYFNQETDFEFDRTPSSQQFNIISRKLTKNIKFILIHIQSIQYTQFQDLRIKSQADLTRTDKPALFFWEVQFNSQSYFKNPAKELVNQQNECLDSILIYNYVHPIEVILWKKQGKDSVYVGQFDITPTMFQLMKRVDDKNEQDPEAEKTPYRLNLDKIKKSLRRSDVQEVLLYRKKRISYINKEEDPPLKGEIKVTFKLFEIFEFDAPQNQQSNTVGSPRSLSERERRLLVENSKYGPYQWPDSGNNKALVILITEAGTQIEIINNVEDIQSFLDSGFVSLLKEAFEISGEGSTGRSFSRQRRAQKETDAHINLLKQLDDKPLVLEVDNMRKTIRKGRLPKQDLEALLLNIGCTASELLIDHVDDLGFCEMDYCFDDGNYSAILDTVQELKFNEPANIETADIFAEKLVQNIKNTLIEGKKVQPLFEFLKVAEKIPDFGITIALIADQFVNGPAATKNENQEKEISPGAFISYFDINSRNFEKMENYEHVMVLGKITKLAKKFLPPENPFVKHLQTNYDDVKTKIYFTVPVLPKKKDLKAKKHLLVLQGDNVVVGSMFDLQIDKKADLKTIAQQIKKGKKEYEQKPVEEFKPCLWNVAHELVRRQRWKMFYDGFEACPDYYYQQGASGNTPLLDFFEKAPFDVQNQTVMRYHPNNPNEEVQDLPKFKIEKIVQMRNLFGKSYMHALSLNQTGNYMGQAMMMKTFQPLIDPDTWKDMLTAPMKPHDCTPLALFINKLSSTLINPKPEEVVAVKEIIQLLKEPFEEELNFKPFEYRAKQFLAMHEQGYDGDAAEEQELANYYFHHQQLTKAIAQLQPDGIKLLMEELKWIEWFGPNIEKYNKKTTDVPYAIFNLARQGKLSYLEELLEDFQRKQPLMECVIQPKSDFIISNYQAKFIEKEDESLKIFDEKEEQNIEYNQEEMVSAMAQFYAKYPLEAFIGIQECLNDSKFTTQKLNKLLKTLILNTIQTEPRILAKQFYRKTLSSPYEDLVKLGFEEDLNQILNDQQIAALAPKTKDLAKTTFKQAFNGELKKAEEPLKFDNKQASAFYRATNKMMTEKSLDEVLRFMRKIEQEKIPNRDDVQKRLMTQIARSLPNSFAKNQYPKIFKALRSSKVNDGVIKQVLNAALASNNQQLVNQCLLHLWNKNADNVKKRNSGILRPMYQKYGQAIQALQYHPAVILSDSDYQKFLQDTKDVATQQDFEIAAEALVKFGVAQRLPSVLEKFAQANPEKVVKLLEDIALNQLEKLLTQPPLVPTKPNKNPVFLKQQPTYVIPTKKQVILTQMNLLEAGAVGCLLQNAINAFYKKPAHPKTYDSILSYLNKQAWQQLYLQKLRENFYKQNPATVFNNAKLPEPQVEKVVQLLVDALKDKINEIAANPELKEKLEKISLLPLISKSYEILEKFENRNKRIFLSIEKIILLNLKLNPTQAELDRISQRTEQNLAFIEKYFNPTLLDYMKEEKNRTFRLLRAADYTLKRSAQPLQIKFAGDFVLIITRNFQPSDFDGILDSSTEFYFNAIAVSLLRSKTVDQKAIDFMGTQLNKYQFYDLVFGLLYDKDDDNNKGKADKKKESKVFNSIETLPNKLEIDTAQVLLVPSTSNLQYILKLLKAKVKPFFKSYSKDKNFVNGTPFGIDDLKVLPLFEYLIAKCQYTLISKYYISVYKPKKQLTEDQITKYLCLAASSGSYTLFDLISEQILNFKLSIVYKQYDTQPQLQQYLNLPIFYQVLTYSSEESSTLYFINIITEGITEELFFNWLKVKFEEDGETDPSPYNCFVPIIKKNYGNLFNKIINSLRTLLPTQESFVDRLTQIFNTTLFVESQQTQEDDSNTVELQLTLLEFSIQQGFPDMCMAFQPKMELTRNPFEGEPYVFLKDSLKAKSKWMPEDETALQQYCKKFENDPQNYRVSYYKIFLILKKYMNFSDPAIRNKIQSSILLFQVFAKYKFDLCVLFPSKLIGTIDDYIIEKKKKKQTYVEQFAQLHFSGFDKSQNFKTSIIEYLQKYHQPAPYWAQKEVIDSFKQLFGFQMTNPLVQMDQDDPQTISNKLELLNQEVLMYILYNNQDLFLNPTENNKFFYFNYNLALPILRQFSANQKEFEEKILGEKKKDKAERQQTETEQQQEYYDRIIKEFEVEEVELNYKFAAILFMYLGQCNERITYVGEEQTENAQSKIMLILQNKMESMSIQQIDNFIVHLTQSLRNNQIYQIAMQWTADSNKSITKDIMKEKSFIQGILNFLNKNRKFEVFQANYQQNELLKLFQFEFARTDKLSKDKIYRGLCIIHIVLNLIQEIQYMKELVEEPDQVVMNIEIMEFSKAKQAEIKSDVIQEGYEGAKKDWFKFEMKVPMIYQEKNNLINLSFPFNIVKDFKSIQQKKRITEIKVQQLLSDIKEQGEKFISQVLVTINIKQNLLQQQYENFNLIEEQATEKFPFQIGKDFSTLQHEIDLDFDIFDQDDTNTKIPLRKQLQIEEEVRIQSYMDVTKYEHNMQFEIQFLKKDQYFQKCKRETQIKLMLDDFVKKQKQIKYIDSFLEQNLRVDDYKTYYKQVMKDDDIDNEKLKQLKESYKDFPTTPNFQQQFEWPVCIENNRILTDDCNIPLHLMKVIISVIDSLFSEPIHNEGQKKKKKIEVEKKFLINYYSFIETLILWQAKINEIQKQSTTSGIPIESIVYQALQWPMLHYTMDTISKLFAKSNLIFEMKETCKPSVMPQIQGLDDSILLSQTQYFYYKGMIVVRLGVFYNKKTQSVIDRTVDQNLRYSQNFAMNSNLEPYTKYVINEQKIQELLQFLQEKGN